MRRTRTLVCATMMACTLAGCGGGVADDPDFKGPLTWASFGGKFQDDQIEAWQRPSTAATGISFQNVSPFDQGQLRAMVEAGRPVWDIVTPGGSFVDENCDVLFSKLTEVKPEDFVEGAMGSECSAPAYIFANIFAYNADDFPDHPPTEIGDFFDVKKFPGKRVIYDTENTGLLEAALVADGVAPKDLYPLDLDRGFKKIDLIKNDLSIVPTLGAVGQALTDKQAVMTLTVTARMLTSVQGGANLKPVWDFTTYAPGVMAIPKGVQHLTAANRAIKGALSPEAAIKYAELTGTAPALAAVTPDMVRYTDVQREFNYAEDDRGTVIPQDAAYWGHNRKMVTQRWNDWKIG